MSEAPALKTPQFGVFDDFLPESEFHLLWNHLRDAEYVFVNRVRWEGVYGLLDGRPLEGAGLLSRPLEELSGVAAYPTGSAMDFIVRRLLELAPRLAPWVGQEEVDWHYLTARPFLFPQGSALAWHDDGANRTGAFSYYAHPSWNCRWGGELCVARVRMEDLDLPDEEVPGKGPCRLPLELDNRLENEPLLADGIGYYIAPRPNRLVVMAPGYLHRIARVEPAAGAAVRCSVSGFFTRRAPPRGRAAVE